MRYVFEDFGFIQEVFEPKEKCEYSELFDAYFPEQEHEKPVASSSDDPKTTHVPSSPDFIPPTQGQEQQKSTPSYVLKTTKVQKTNAKGDTISTLNMRNVHKLVPSSEAAKIACPQGWMSKEPASWPLESQSTSSSVPVVSSGNGNDESTSSGKGKSTIGKRKGKGKGKGKGPAKRKSSEILEEILDCPRSDDEFASKK